MAIIDDASPDDYQAIEADITAMEDFATRLAAGVADGYNSQLSEVARRMQTLVPAGHAGFPELRIFLEQHQQAQLTAFSNATNFREGTMNAANAAQKVSDEYRGSDAFAHASVDDINNAFTTVTTPTDSTGPDSTGGIVNGGN